MNEKTDESSTASAPLSDRPRNANGHTNSCVCTLCARIQARIAAGKPTKEEERAQRRAQRLATEALKKPTARPGREQRLAKDAALAASVATQIALGQKPSATLAAKIADIDPSTAQGKTRAGKLDESVHAALLRAGITNDRLFAVASEGLDAKSTRLVTDKDGRVVDAIEFPDHQNRHRFWRDLLMVKGYLGREDTSQVPSGGLIIIAPDAAKVVPGHVETCMCEECIAAWDEKTKELRLLEEKRNANDAELVESAVDGVPMKPSQPSDPESSTAPESEVTITNRIIGDEEDYYQLDDNEEK